MMNTYMDTAGGRDDFEIFSGSLGTIMTCMERGGKGGIVSAANYFPNACGKLCRIWKEEGPEVAKEYHAKVLAASKATGAKASVAGVKACMNLMGYTAGVPRIPVLPCSEELTEEFREAIGTFHDLIQDDLQA
jgi:dihydrodipicolinate synthase/N-acetylneuraminate lyase